ncbi:MAG: hypothetical protein ABFD08_14690 [Syntrophomonas sp.]
MVLRKMDEMEMYITLKSIKIAWVYTIIYLLAWTIYDFVTTAGIGLPFNLLVTQNLIFWAAQMVYQHKMVGKNEE